MAATPLSNKYRLSGKERWDVVSDRRERRCGWASERSVGSGQSGVISGVFGIK